MYQRNIANIVHELNPLSKSFKNKLLLLSETERDSDFQQLLNRIKMDALIFGKYCLAIKKEAQDFGVQLSCEDIKNLGNVVQEMEPIIKSLQNHMSLLNSATRSSDFIKALRKVMSSSESLDNYVKELDIEAKSHNLDKAKPVCKLLNLDI